MMEAIFNSKKDSFYVFEMKRYPRKKAGAPVSNCIKFGGYSNVLDLKRP